MSSLALAQDTDLGAAVLKVADGALRSVNVVSRLTDGSVDRTMDGASTLTLMLDDHRRDLLRSGVLDRQVDLQLDGLWWRLVKVSKSGDQLTLTFEDRQVAFLREITTPRKASRSKMTRAEFALSIVREVKKGGGIAFVCPDLHTTQQIASATVQPAAATSTTQGSSSLDQGIASGTALTIKGAPATPEQRSNGEAVLQVAAQLNAGPRATLALLQACIQESTMRNLNYGDADSLGILQVRSSTAAGMNIDNRDVAQCANAFLTRGFWGRGGAITIAAKNPSMSTGQVAQNTQGSAYPTAYDQWKTEAQQWLNAFGGVGSSSTISTTQTVKQLPFQFMRGAPDGPDGEDSWACLQRLASDVGWRCFMADGACYFVAETTLIKAKPKAVLTEISTGSFKGVVGIDFDVDNGKPVSEATVTARAGRLAFPPGSVLQLADSGPANGRWLVAEVSRGIFDAQATIRLKRPTEPLPEPAPETTTITSSSSSPSLVSSAGAGVPAAIDAAYQTAASIDAKRYPYVWGGGHGAAGTPSGGPPVGFDCSGSTCAVLAGGNMGYRSGGPVDVSGTIAAQWGQAGEGQFLTVWANAIHVWMEFKGDQGPQHFGTGDWGKSWGGAGFNPEMHPKAGFTPRHWPGT